MSACQYCVNKRLGYFTLRSIPLLENLTSPLRNFYHREKAGFFRIFDGGTPGVFARTAVKIFDTYGDTEKKLDF